MTKDADITSIAAPSPFEAAVLAHRQAESAMRAAWADKIEGEALDAIERADDEAWLRVIHTPALTAAALAQKVGLALVAYHGESAADLGDAHLMQGLLNEISRTGGQALVRVYQDALRLAGEHQPICDLRPSQDEPWPVFAAAYRAAWDDFEALDETGMDAAHDRQMAWNRALLGYPVATVAELAEKIELIGLDVLDDEEAYAAVAADVTRLAGVGR